MLVTRRILASLCWLFAAALVSFATLVWVALTREYGLSPNHDPVLDVANTLLTYVLPVGIVTSVAAWGGWRLWYG
jgi:hypothetical protein